MIRKLMLAAGAAAAASVIVTAAAAFTVPDSIVLERPKGNQPLAVWVDQVTFPHDFHTFRVACKSCHHKEVGENPGSFVACRQCHASDDPTEQTGFYRAWHSDGPPSCLGCHTQMRTRGGKNPVGCTTACHKPG